MLRGSRNSAIQDFLGFDDGFGVPGLGRLHQLGDHLLCLGIVGSACQRGGEVGNCEQFLRRDGRVPPHDAERNLFDVERSGLFRELRKLEICPDLIDGLRMGRLKLRECTIRIVVLETAFQRVFLAINLETIGITRGLETRDRPGVGSPRDRVSSDSIPPLRAGLSAIGAVRIPGIIAGDAVRRRVTVISRCRCTGISGSRRRTPHVVRDRRGDRH